MFTILHFNLNMHIPTKQALLEHNFVLTPSKKYTSRESVTINELLHSFQVSDIVHLANCVIIVCADLTSLITAVSGCNNEVGTIIYNVCCTYSDFTRIS